MTGIPYTIISAATKGSPYVEMLQRLQLLYGAHPVKFRGIIFKDLGGWTANTRVKPLSISEGLLRGLTVLAVDADTLVTPPPEVLPEGDWDIGVLDQFVPGHKNPWCACIIAARPTPLTVTFMMMWMGLCMANPGQQDHGHLTTAIKRMQTEGLKLLQLEDTLRGRVHFNALSPDRKQAKF